MLYPFYSPLGTAELILPLVHISHSKFDKAFLRIVIRLCLPGQQEFLSSVRTITHLTKPNEVFSHRLTPGPSI